MFAIGIRYLCGWAMATDTADRLKAEWPPHPDRVFMALAAAHFETDGGPEEYEALKRLSGLGPPSISASGARPRQVVTTFVPVNDDVSPISKKGRPMMPSGSLAIGRDRQPRSFPVTIPDSDEVFLIWDRDVSNAERCILDALCRKVAAVGHSASLVQMWATEAPSGSRTLIPVSRLGTPHRLRVPDGDRLETLSASYKDELRPTTAVWHGYGSPNPEPKPPDIPGSVFDPALIVLSRVDGRPIGLESTLQLTEALRGAIMKSHQPERPPDWISGHDGPDGPPLRSSHLAFIPLPHVGRTHADGRLMGVALVVPKSIPPEEVLRELSGFLYEANANKPAERSLFDGRFFEWRIALEDREEPPWSLRQETWTAPSERWGSVTPVVLDRYPKGKNADARAAEIEATIRKACENIGLPEPADVVVSPSPPFVGVPHARAFPPFCRPGGSKRFHIHAVLRFAEPVRGPILVGAGRYRGYGLFRPLGSEG